MTTHCLAWNFPGTGGKGMISFAHLPAEVRGGFWAKSRGSLEAPWGILWEVLVTLAPEITASKVLVAATNGLPSIFGAICWGLSRHPGKISGGDTWGFSGKPPGEYSRGNMKPFFHRAVENVLGPGGRPPGPRTFFPLRSGKRFSYEIPGKKSREYLGGYLDLGHIH